ncbi:hypothetical protein M2103_000310 [Ereboglobus sp. PH5-5]|uniref:SEL1-like repeat protein n=1 Tax=Ereboglobus sp. PH5-5 TaxID=2940529 RepID=UPI0024058E2B|nr:SEL1-like repeat protein [Ereboglobus sp. PH5-5]MDF9832102.1 hypothetical protein [Ereboglobus sp. PH5-5]
MKCFRFTCEWNKTSPDAEIVAECDRCCMFLSLMYEYHFPKTKTGARTRALVTISSNTPAEPPTLAPVSGDLDVCATADWSAFRNLPTPEKHARLLAIIQQSLLAAARANNWPAAPFETACAAITRNNFLFREHYKKSVAAPDKLHRAQIYFEHDYLGSGTHVDFTDKRGTLLKRVAFTPGGSSVLCKSIGPVEWINNRQILIYHVLVDRSGLNAETNHRHRWIIDIDGGVEYQNPSATEANPHALYNLGLLYWEGKIILPDKNRGREIITKAAALGYKHAQNWLRRNEP